MIKYKSTWMSCSLVVALLGVLSGCGSSTPPQSLNYDQTKSMVLDILKSDEAKKTIEKNMSPKESVGQSKMKILSTPEGQQIQVAVKDAMMDPQFSKHLEKLMADPKFAGDFAKAIEKQNIQLQKQLMKDPEYQNLMINLMKHTDLDKMILDVLKGPQYRAQSLKTMQEVISSPLYKSDMLELIKKVYEDEQKPKDEKMLKK